MANSDKKQEKSGRRAHGRVVSALNRHLPSLTASGHASRWVTADALGRELLSHWNRETNREIAKQARDVTPQTLKRRKEKAYACNKARVSSFVSDLKDKDLVFYKISFKDGETRHRGSPRGRKEIQMLADAGIIDSTRAAKYRPALSRGADTYIEIEASRIADLRGLAKKAFKMASAAKASGPAQDEQPAPAAKNAPAPKL